MADKIRQIHSLLEANAHEGERNKMESLKKELGRLHNKSSLLFDWKDGMENRLEEILSEFVVLKEQVNEHGVEIARCQTELQKLQNGNGLGLELNSSLEEGSGYPNSCEVLAPTPTKPVEGADSKVNHTLPILGTDRMGVKAEHSSKGRSNGFAKAGRREQLLGEIGIMHAVNGGGFGVGNADIASTPTQKSRSLLTGIRDPPKGPRGVGFGSGANADGVNKKRKLPEDFGVGMEQCNVNGGGALSGGQQTAEQKTRCTDDRKRVCLRCWKFDLSCNAGGAGCGSCIGAGKVCVWKLCDAGSKCKRHPCPMLHPSQWDENDPEWTVERGPLPPPSSVLTSQKPCGRFNRMGR